MSIVFYILFYIIYIFLYSTSWRQVDEFLLREEAKALLESATGWKRQSELGLTGQNNAVGANGGLAFCHSKCQKVISIIIMMSMRKLLIFLLID